MLAWAEESAARLAELEGDDDRIGELTAERDALRAELAGLAQTLTDARTEAAAAVRRRGHRGAGLELAMPHARVSFDIRQTEAADEAAGIEVGRPYRRVTGRTASTRSSCCSPRTPARSRGPSPRAPPAVSSPG